MLVAIWIITFCLIIGIGVYAGTKIKSANQWSGGDKTMGALTLGCVFAAWQIGGMAVVGAAQNGLEFRVLGIPSQVLSTLSHLQYLRKSSARGCRVNLFRSICKLVMISVQQGFILTHGSYTDFSIFRFS